MNGYNFTMRVRRTLALAREEAERLHHDAIETEHLLLSLLHEEKGIAAQVLMAVGVTLARTRQETVRLIGTAWPKDRLPISDMTARLEASASSVEPSMDSPPVCWPSPGAPSTVRAELERNAP